MELLAGLSALAVLVAGAYGVRVAGDVGLIRIALADAGAYRGDIIDALLTMRLTRPARWWLTHHPT